MKENVVHEIARYADGDADASLVERVQLLSTARADHDMYERPLSQRFAPRAARERRAA